MVVLLAALVVSSAVVWAGFRVAADVQRLRPDPVRRRVVDLLAMFAPAVDAAAADPRAILVWQPVARIAREIFPEEFRLIDQAAGGSFPFGKDRLQSAHAQWTADWLAWERTHDAEFKLKAALVEQEIATSGTSGVLRARLEAVEREKLDLYQRR